MSTSTSMLSRMTLSYDVHEDRVLISGELATGRLILLSLTRRLLNKLIPHLTTTDMSLSDSSRSASDTTSFPHGVENSQKQNEIPVSVDASCETVLITSIDIKTAANHLVLEWKDKGDRKIAQLVLDHVSLPAWLNALKICFEKGSWSDEAWKLEQVSAASSRTHYTVH